MAAKKMRPDFLIQKRIQQDNQYAVAADYASKMAAISQVTHWFEGKQKFDFAETEKRSSEFIKQEMDACSEELKIRRRTRLRLLYETEARAYESELAALGLAVQRMVNWKVQEKREWLTSSFRFGMRKFHQICLQHLRRLESQGSEH